MTPEEQGKLAGAVAAYLWAVVALLSGAVAFYFHGWPALTLGALLAIVFKAAKPP